MFSSKSLAKNSSKERGVKIDRIVCAVDCGVAIHPDIVVAQIEGSVGFGLSMVLRDQISFKDGLVEQYNFDDYNATRVNEMPKVEVYIVKSTELPWCATSSSEYWLAHPNQTPGRVPAGLDN